MTKNLKQQLLKHIKMKTITYDDTRDCAIRIIDKLIELGLLEDNDDNYFDIQDTITEEYNELLGLDIDDNFEVKLSY